jgi:hypothetical protein
MSEETPSSPSGTIIRAPVSPPVGKPVVSAGDYTAVKVHTWKRDAVVLAALIGIPALEAVKAYLAAGGKVTVGGLVNVAISGAIGGLIALLRVRTNTVLG